jgi:methyltransferase (TIGR00027 family)
MEDSTIHHVSDTALWVAHYRAVESARSDALFHDPFAARLAGERGRRIASHMGSTARHTSWQLSIRTHIIDDYIRRLVDEGVDLVLNLGAGLDARPYRLSLPESLDWVEVDYPHMIEHKEKILAGEKPRCRLQSVKLDLADRGARQALFTELGKTHARVLVLTEGVMPYLTVQQGEELADDLHAVETFRFWIAEYFAKYIYKYIRDPRRMKRLKNSPFQFYPDDWFGLFKAHGWTPREVKYMPQESIRLKRRLPVPWWMIFMRPFISKKAADQFLHSTGYVLFQRAEGGVPS